jgi:hypothetical protein
MVRKRRSPIGEKVKTEDQSSINKEFEKVDLSCGFNPYNMYVIRKDKVSLETAIEVGKGEAVIVYIGKQEKSRLDKLIAGLAARRSGEFKYLSEITGRKISDYSEEIEVKGSKISHFLKIGVGYNTNFNSLIEINAGELYIDYNHLPLSGAKTIECIERQIDGYIKREIMSLSLSPQYLGEPTISFSIKLRAASIGEKVETDIGSVMGRHKIRVSYTLNNGKKTESGGYDMYIFYSPNKRQEQKKGNDTF